MALKSGLKSRGQDGMLPSRNVRAVELLAWLAMAIAWTGIWCWLSVLVAERFAPVVVLPLLAGLVLGAGYVMAMRLAGLASRTWLMTGTCVLSLALAAGQHYIWYRITQTAMEQGYSAKLSGNNMGALAASIPDLHPSFVGFLQATAARGRAWAGLRLHGGWVWASWVLDALLQSAAAMVLVWIAAGQAYCCGCRSWYRVVRQGKLDPSQAAALATLCEFQTAKPSLPDEYRLLHCRSGCGPVRLDLVEPDAGLCCSKWFDSADRRRVFEVLEASPDRTLNAIERPPHVEPQAGAHADSLPETPQ